MGLRGMQCELAAMWAACCHAPCSAVCVLSVLCLALACMSDRLLGLRHWVDEWAAHHSAMPCWPYPSLAPLRSPGMPVNGPV